MKPKSSAYVNNERREYSLYVLSSRAIPALSDGLKAAARRVLWTARNGKVFKSATLAGATMPIHPHASPESTIDTLAADYGNNIPLLKGDGAFGTLLNPTAYGASRYTSVSVSEFTKDVLFRDIEIIPMQENYDGTLEEPIHFLPLIPIVFLNPTEGIAVGFACNILPRSLIDIIALQIQHLRGKPKEMEDVFPYFAPTDSEAVEWIDGENIKWIFHGAFRNKNSNTITITKLPYGVFHEKFVNNLMKLIDDGIILDYEDNSSDIINIDVKFKRGELEELSKKDILSKLGLINSVSENINVIDFDGESVLSGSFIDLLKQFTDWRLSWYKNRYERLASLLRIDIQKYKDVITAINKNVGNAARNTKSRAELRKKLKTYKIVHDDYIADLPIYRFTEEEKDKTQKKLDEAEALLIEYEELLSSELKRKKIYIKELTEVLKKYSEQR